MEDPDLRKKRLRLACRRGFLEVELVLRPWVEARLERLTPAEVDDLERILALEDLDLWEIICGRRPGPEGLVTDLLARLRADLVRLRPQL
ncbi:MAG: succinate dehydrogenase assembly factor 2 [Desulfarculus sp.]|nr:succinate dehydrogenase assembly factor 2 [Desulfarculus sp.]